MKRVEQLMAVLAFIESCVPQGRAAGGIGWRD